MDQADHFGLEFNLATDAQRFGPFSHVEQSKIGKHQDSSPECLAFDANISHAPDKELQRCCTCLRVIDVFEDFGVIEIKPAEQLEPELAGIMLFGFDVFSYICGHFIQRDEALAEPVLILADVLSKRSFSRDPLWSAQDQIPAGSVELPC